MFKICPFVSAHIGDTIHRVGEVVEPMAGFQPAKAMVSFQPTIPPPKSNSVHVDFYRSLLEYIPSTAATFQSSRSLSIGYRLFLLLIKICLPNPQISKLTLTDRSVTVQRETSSALGQGCRLGFLGTLHMDVFRQRLEDEYDANVIITAPTVPYKSKHSPVTMYSGPPAQSISSHLQRQGGYN